MLRIVASQMLKWLVTNQMILIILIIVSVLPRAGNSKNNNTVMITDQSRAILEMAKAVRIRSTEDIFLLLTQSMQFTKAMNPFPKFPITSSKTKMIVNVLSKTPPIVSNISDVSVEELLTHSLEMLYLSL
jgi:hypothetical protein